MDEKTFYAVLFGALLSLTSVLLTKLWDLWREKSKNSYEDKKLLKKALYQVMKIWGFILPMDVENNVSVILKAMEKKFLSLGVKT